LGVDVSRLRGSGPDGEIVAEDVQAAAKSASAAPAAPVGAAPAASSAQSVSSGSGESLSSIGRLMAERTTQSWTTVPHFFVTRQVDGGAIVAIREKLAPAIEKNRGVKLTYTDLLTAIVARVLKQHPRMNASWIGDGIRTNPEVKMGLAMAVIDGVVVAVINKADAGDLADIAVQRRDLTERARAGKLTPANISGATFTISNLGMYHVDEFTAIIVPPQAGILAVGAMTDRVVPMPGALIPVGVRPMLTLTLSCDHRVVDGARGAAFLHDVVEALQQADRLLA
jgi:pyruvate dehydrogenase E2 component (dihydrolipoamide acetyltransferase)